MSFIESIPFGDGFFDPRSTAPDISVFFDGGKKIDIRMPETGINGVYTLPFMTILYKNVTRIEVKIRRSGAVTALTYPYCPKTPKTAISIKKYAGPPNLCHASGVLNMQDVAYTVPNDAQWAYCYAISVPSTSEEYLYDIKLTYPASAGGIGTIKVTTASERLCPGGETRYIVGPTRSSWQVQKDSIEAIVEGYGYYSGVQVTNRDSVTATGSIIPPSPPQPVVSPTLPPTLPTALPAAPVSPLVPSAPPVSFGSPTACPLISLNFTNLVNPMARYYGQRATLQGGDYLFDQLWWTHGVKVSARIRETDHWDNDDDIFIPKFIREIGWVDSKRNQSVDNHRTGGAVRLFDTLRPMRSLDSRYNQPLCTFWDGDSRLGAPNRFCAGGGPGKKESFVRRHAMIYPPGIKLSF